MALTVHDYEHKSWGHTGCAGGHVVLKRDNENPVKAFKDAVGTLLGGRVIPENPPKGESQSNGRIEEAGKTIRGFVRVMKDQVETEAAVKLEGRDNIVQWLVRWGAMVPSRFLVGKDGKTPFERRRGRTCNIPTEKFGEHVWYKGLRTKSELLAKLESEWKEGLWLGHARSSNEILIGTREGVVRAWAIRKKPEGEQWDAGLIKEMKGTPCRPNPNKAGNFIPVAINFDTTEDVEVDGDVRPARTEGMPRAVYIKGWMMETYGYTEDCSGCAAKRAGMSVAKTHTQQHAGSAWKKKLERPREVKRPKPKQMNDGFIGRPEK